MLLNIVIPVKPHVKKYLVDKNGLQYRLNKRDHLGITLFHLLRRPSVDNRLNERLVAMTETYNVDIGAFSFFKKGCRNLDAYTIIQFNSLVEDLIEAEFCGTVEFLEMFGVEQKQAIEVFMAKYSFEESDIKFDSLKKAYQRYCNKKLNAGKKKHKGAELLPFLFALKAAGAIGSRKKLKKVTKMTV